MTIPVTTARQQSMDGSMYSYEEEVLDDDVLYEEEVLVDDDFVEEVVVEEEYVIEEEVIEVIEEEDLKAIQEEADVRVNTNRRSATRRGTVAVGVETFVLKKVGLQMERDASLGRIVTASQDLTQGLVLQTILREMPALVCQQEDYLHFMEKFLEAPMAHQMALMDMYHQPLDTSPLGKSLKEPAKELFLLGIMGDDVDGSVFHTIHRLLSILQTNGHEYTLKGRHYTALPIFGSKLAHSCAPNVGYVPTACADGSVEYKLLKPIREGEMACISYLSDLLETPTNERRKILMETKNFKCRCERCQGPDYCRCLPCTECQKLIPCRYKAPEEESSHDDSSSEDEAYWECPQCGMLEADQMAVLERQFAKMLEMIHRSIEKTNKNLSSAVTDEYSSPTVLQELVQECQTELSPTHHLTMNALRLLFSTASLRAYAHIKKRIYRGLPPTQAAYAHMKKGVYQGLPGTQDATLVFNLFRISVEAGYQLVAAAQCVAAGCSDPDEDTEPNYNLALPMSHISDNLLHLPLHWWPPTALTRTQQYMPLLRARFGPLVDHIDAGIVQRWKDVKCLECGTYFDGLPKRKEEVAAN